MARKASETLAECDVPCPNRLDAAIVEAEAECTVGVEAFKAAGQAVPGAVVDGERGTGRVSAGEPGVGEGVGSGIAPKRQHSRHACCEQRGEGLWSYGCVAGECAGGAALDCRSRREVDAEAGDDAVANPLKQDAGELGPAEKQVVGPFEQERCARDGGVKRLDQGETAGERKSWCRRIMRLELNEGRAGEIALRRFPRAALAAPALVLGQRDQPVALDRTDIAKQCGVGRADPVDDADARQKRLAAALPVRRPSGPINR
jgi:hypothetical protein